MTETTTPLTEPPPEAPTGSAIPIHPSDILMNLIVAFLAPMFLGASAGDIGFARMAAIETVNAYRARNQSDLIAIAQIIAFGLGALGSLSLSMAENLSLSMTLRLRGNANACNRSAEQNRRAVAQNPGDNPTYHPATRAEPETQAATRADQDAKEAALLADLAAAKQLAADVQARMRPEKPATEQTPIPTPAAIQTAPMTTPQRNRAWANAMIQVAGSMTADLRNLPPAQRRVASIRASALTSTAHRLLSGVGLPPLDQAIRVAINRPNTI